MKHVFEKKLRAVSKLPPPGVRRARWTPLLWTATIAAERVLSLALSKSRLRGHHNQVAAKEALAKAEAAHQEMNRKAQATDQSVTNLMGELLRTVWKPSRPI